MRGNNMALLQEVTEEDVRSFWDAHPCGDHQVDSLGGDYQGFFRRYDGFRDAREAHILRRLDAFDWNGRRVLEIGLVQGADSFMSSGV